MIQVGLIGPADRQEMDRLAMRLEERGAEGVVLDSREDPRIEVSADGERACGVELSKMKAFYVADLGLLPALVEEQDGDRERQAATLARSRRHLAAWNVLLARLATRVPVVNPPRTHELHGLKPWELEVYRGRDLPVPETIVTSDAGALSDWFAGDRRRWIRKDLVGGYAYTEAFAPEDAAQVRAAVADRPALVQERVEGENVRVFVVGGDAVAAAEFVPRSAEETDSRRGELRVRRVEVTEEIGRVATAAADAHGLLFSAVDLMRDAAGRHCILEANSAPFFVGFEKQTGVEVSSHLADLLLGRGRHTPTA